MDATVNDFLKEINEIVPAKPRAKTPWKECFDDSSGFAYYWNTQTDEVTWEMPPEYKTFREQNPKTSSSSSKHKLFIPPKIDTLFPRVKEDTVKIYKINETKPLSFPPKRHSKNCGKLKESSSESDDERIVLISSYGGETESDSDEEQAKTETPTTGEPTILGPHLPPPPLEQHVDNAKSNNVPSDVDDDDTDLLTQIQNRAKVLKDLGGELPDDVKKLVDDNPDPKFDKKDVTGFSLVAGYGEDSDEEDDAFPTKRPPPLVSHSTLFPIAPPIDVEQFATKTTCEKPTSVNDNVDVKVFQRKRRIGIDLVNMHKRKAIEVPPPSEPDSEKVGLGFKTANVDYAGFKSGGVMFVKSDDVLHPSPPLPEENHEEDRESSKDDKIIKEIENIQVTLGEKLKFLSEGRNPALPVQVLIIQMETLYGAMKANSLKPNYLKAWLRETCEELIKLEKEAAPSGWLLQWDRLHKRYYYHNQTSNESQWEYPQADIVGGDDAMDICTTPPPPNEDHSNESVNMNMIVPPPPPRIKQKSLSPPPPPVISGYKLKQPVKEKSADNDEPLPPGVDASDVETVSTLKDVPAASNDELNSALNSFYSDLAAIEIPPAAPAKVEEALKSENAPAALNVVPVVNEQPVTLQTTKKKKTKAKMAQGLAMKKKGVSKLVEKWKNVQKNYD